MKRIYGLPGFLLSISCFGFCIDSPAQEDAANNFQPVTDSILKEGIAMYECAMATKLSSGFLFEKLSMEELSGSITYRKAGMVHTIFLSEGGRDPVVRYTFSFPAPFEPGNMKLDGEPRPLSDYETSLYGMRSRLLKLARKRKPFFTNYEGIVLNPVFMDKGSATYVYLLPSSHDDSFIPLGDDYLLVFNERSKLVSKEKIHQNLIEISAGTAEALQPDQALASYHTHSELSSPFITATDICMLLLHMENVDWQSHIVLSAEYVSFFFPEQRVLEVMTREEYDKMSESEEKE